MFFIGNTLFKKETNRSPFRILFRKGAPEIIIFLASVEKARYSEIKKQKFVIGDRSLSRILKLLQSRNLIRRETLATVPVSTLYSLTDKGKLAAKHLMELKEVLVSHVRTNEA